MSTRGPSAAVRAEREKRLNGILSFASDLQLQLCPNLATPSATPLLARLEEAIETFPPSFGSYAVRRYEDLDSNGTALWNLCTRLRREHESEKSDVWQVLLLMARVYAFLLLDCAQSGERGTVSNVVRLFKIGLKAAKGCIDNQQPDLALRVLQKVATYDGLLQKQDAHENPEDAELYKRLSAQYFVVRMCLAWRQDQLEAAEHMYNKALNTKKYLDFDTAISLADTMFEMGKEMLGNKQHEMAVKWLDRSYEAVMHQEQEKLGRDENELRLSIIQTLVKALVAGESQEASDKAQNLIQLLESEVGDKLVVLLLKLELLSASTNDVFDSNAYRDVVWRITQTAVLSDPNFKLIMHHIRKLHIKSPSLASSLLDDFLRTRVLQHERDDWIEKVLITRIWMGTCQREDPNVIASVGEVLKIATSNIEKPLSALAAHAAQTLIWKQIESSYGQAQYHHAEQWCRLAMHQLFAQSGEMNLAKAGRKLLLCALARQDVAGAREHFQTMSKAAKNEPLTRYLMFKVALRGDDPELAAESLEKVYASSAKDATLLYACAMDAQQVGNKEQALAALQLVLQKHDYSVPDGVHLPALLRCTIRLMASQIEGEQVKSSKDMPKVSDHLCKIFEAAATQAQKSRAPVTIAETLFTVSELDWFSKNAYNLALKFSTTWEPHQVLRMLQVCIKFISLYPLDATSQNVNDLSLRRMFCDFLAATLLIVQARPEDNIEIQLQDYLVVRKHVANFATGLDSILSQMEEGPTQDLLRKLEALLAYDFEAACLLKAWNDLGAIITKAEVCKSTRVYELMADCILSAEAPTQEVITTLKIIINKAWNIEKFDTPRLAKYMRCLFQYALPHDAAIAEELLDQVHQLAEVAESTTIPYPPEELEYIAITTFNRAIDFYCVEDDEACRKWATKALAVATFVGDGGVLLGVLQGKLVGLEWDG